MKKETKIRSPFVQQLVEDRENLENIIKDTTKSSLSEILEDTVKNELNKLIKEDNEEDDNYDEDDNEAEDTKTSDDTEINSDDAAVDTDNDDSEEEVADPVEKPESEEGDENMDGSEEDNDGWDEFEQYKGDDDTYDFRNADNDTIVKVYKLLKDDDQVFVEKDEEGNTHLTDNETGNEYMIVNDSDDMGGETDFDGSDIDENTIYEIALNDNSFNESNLGYTDDYQNKTAMTTPPNNDKSTKSARYIDDGVPSGSEKPWPGDAGDMDPFTESCEDNMEEGTNVGGFVQQNSTSKSHVPNSNGRDARNASVAGVHTKSTSQPRYSSVSEDIKRKANALWQENKAMKKELLNIKKSLEEAVVLNYNLGQITKLFTENTTSREEKVNIIKRFGNEAKTIEDSKKLYESISKELKKVDKISGVKNIDRQIKENKETEKSLIETPIYQNKDLTESLSLIKRISEL